MTHAIQFAATGGPEVLEWVEVSVPDPGAGQARVAHTAIGLNFIDTYYRSGVYPVKLPSGLGSEAAGVVTAIDRRSRGLRESAAGAVVLGGVRHGRALAREAAGRHRR